MKIVLDACVLYPTVMRELVVGCAEQGLFTPVWSPRLLEEWARAARKIGPDGESIARGEIAALQARFPQAEYSLPEGAERAFWLPDPADIHVLVAAVKSSSDAIMTLNAKDFPKNVLGEYGLQRLAPDEFLISLFHNNPDAVGQVGQTVLAEAIRLSGKDWTIRDLLRKARLPRLGKALAQMSDS